MRGDERAACETACGRDGAVIESGHPCSRSVSNGPARILGIRSGREHEGGGSVGRTQPIELPKRRWYGNELTVAGIFAGIGGIELGLSGAGHRCELFCEIDEGAQAVLSKQFSDIPLIPDVRNLAVLPDVDLVSAGFPCQDLSQAGRRCGINGHRSGLVEEVFRMVAQSNHSPEWILLENVPFMLHLNRGAAMRYLTSRLEGLGFAWAYRTVDTRAFGLPQRRRRVLLLASRSEDPRSVLLADDAGEPAFHAPHQVACGFYWTEGNRGLGWAVDAIPPLKGSSGVGIPSPPGIWSPTERAIVTPDIRDAERMQGFPMDWTAPALSSSHSRKQLRWRLVGNAVSVPVAQWVGERLLQPGFYDGSADRLLLTGSSWPAAAWGMRGGIHSANRSAWPIRTEHSHLAEFLKHPTSLLSARATLGFMRRLQASHLRTQDEFICDLAHHADRMRGGIGGLT